MRVATFQVVRFFAAAFFLVAVSSCDPTARAFHAGPFSGQIVDAESGRPVPGAFVGITWGGSSWIEGHYGHLLDVLVQADAEGRYLVPWQGNNLPISGLHSIAWAEEVWAPGYVRLQTGEEELSKETSSTGAGLQTRLTRAGSTIEALTRWNRMDPSSYRNPINKIGNYDSGLLARLALALYRDSYHRVCEDELPDEALAKQYVEAPRADAPTYRHFAATPPHSAKQVADQNDAWAALDRKAGWTDASGPVHEPPPLDKSLLPELCRLSRFEPAFSNPA